ncbi:hypothetical protein PPACK8108_LOCUS2276 [Phakopsora pachyrhizi]|uniref:Uncharacterized protein n=1 Tax=Phakopsora pachyrhizi TaxID=170000 RepID=A0AAV0AI00_PHAPC|nr:hypothetical protein PPACK8108_LOCUS2276 [Phakopsora pachyrhizi]
MSWKEMQMLKTGVEETSEEAVVVVAFEPKAEGWKWGDALELGDELEGDADVEDGKALGGDFNGFSSLDSFANMSKSKRASWRPIGITSTRQEDNFWLMRVKVGDHPARKPVGSLDHDQRIVGWQDEIRDW